MDNHKRIEFLVARLQTLAIQEFNGSVTIHLRKGRAEKVELKSVEALPES